MKYQDIRTRLNKKKQENNQKIALADERTRMAKANQFEQKATGVLIHSMFYYVFILVPSLFMIQSHGLNTITDVIPAIYYPAIVLGGSLGLGTLTTSLQYYKFHIKERIKAFSKAKTESEKIVEEVQYEIEREKTGFHNLAINEAVATLNIQDTFSKTMVYNSLANKTIDYQEAEIEQNIKNLEQLINERSENIDNLATKLVLYNRFYRTASKSERIFNLMMIPFLGMLCTMMFVNLPFFAVKEAITYSSDLASLIAYFIPGVIGYLGTTGYLLKRNHDYKLAFNKLNNQLGNDALPKLNDKSYNKSFEKKEEIKQLIAYQIKEISTAIAKLHEEEQKLAKLATSQENKSKTECKIKSHEEFASEENLLPEEYLQEKDNVLVRKKLPHNENNQD